MSFLWREEGREKDVDLRIGGIFKKGRVLVFPFIALYMRLRGSGGPPDSTVATEDPSTVEHYLKDPDSICRQQGGNNADL